MSRATWIAIAAARPNAIAWSHPANGRTWSSSPLSTSCFHSRALCSRANSRDRASTLPMRLTATRNASSAASPAASRSAIWSRRWASSSSTSRPFRAGALATYARHSAICDSTPSIDDTSADTARNERERDQGQASPEAAQRPRDGHPLALLFGEGGPPGVGDRAVPTAPALGRHPPLGRHVAEAAEAVEQRVQHPVRPLELAAREISDPFQQGVAVALAFRQDRQH